MIIPAGAESVIFFIDGVDDSTADTIQNVNYTATATGFAAARNSLEVSSVGVSTLTIDGSGNLLIADANESADDLTIKSDTTNSRFCDFRSEPTAGDQYFRRGGQRHWERDHSFQRSCRHESDRQQAGAGDDSLTVDFSAGAFSKAIEYNGGDPAIAPGDSLTLQGGSFTDATFNATSASDGDLDFDGQTITYAGLEPITSTVTATNVILNYSAAAETISVSADGATSGHTLVTSTAAETLSFVNPTGSLTINAGDTGDDTIDINSLGTGFDADITISGQSGFDTIIVDGVISQSGKNVSLSADVLDVNQSISTTGGGTISLVADRNIDVSSGVAITTVDGNLTLQSNPSNAPINGGLRWRVP